MDGSWTEHMMRPTWAEVNLEAIEHNVRRVMDWAGAGVRLFAALKGDGYGLGAVEVGRVVLASGAHGLSLANLGECIQLRQAGITAPILLYAGTPPELGATIVRYGITPTVVDLEDAREFSRHAPDGYGVFVKVDVGLERAGVYAEDALEPIEAIGRLPRIRIEGVYTHLHSGSGSAEYARWQFNRFNHLLQRLEKDRVQIPVKLAASSPFIVQHPDMCLNAIDPGHLIFGLPVGAGLEESVGLRPALTAVKTRIVQVKNVRKREAFAEEGPFDTAAATRFGVLPAGWGDGLHRGYGNGGPALVCGRRAAILGPVHYEHSRIDLSCIPEARVGDEVVLLGRQQDEIIAVREVAQRCGLLPAQVSGTLSKHMPVIYFRQGKAVSMGLPGRQVAPLA